VELFEDFEDCRFQKNMSFEFDAHGKPVFTLAINTPNSAANLEINFTPPITHYKEKLKELMDPSRYAQWLAQHALKGLDPENAPSLNEFAEDNPSTSFSD
jgi:hypothetical protein